MRNLSYMPPGNALFPYVPKVKAKLDKMVKLGVITPVDEPTDWVSSVAYAWKASSESCILFEPF